MNWKRQFLYVGLFTLAAAVFLAARNWDDVKAMLSNVATANEGGQIASKMRSPEDVLGYLAGNPERVSLVARTLGPGGTALPTFGDATSGEPGAVAQSATTPRPVRSLPKLLLLAEYYRRVEAETLDPKRRVPVTAMDAFALPGISDAGHVRAVDSLQTLGAIDADSTVALRHVVQAAVLLNDDAAADWLMLEWGSEAVASLPGAFGLSNSEPPQPLSGTYLSWAGTAVTRSVAAQLEALQTDDRAAVLDRVYARTQRLRDDGAFREAERTRLQGGDSELTLAEQRDFAMATYPTGTAADYATLFARIARGTLGTAAVSESLQVALEMPVPGTEPVVEGEGQPGVTAPPITHVASRSAAYPGLLTFAGYARRPDGPPRVVVTLMEDLPMAVFYHLVQTGLDKGVQLHLFLEDDRPLAPTDSGASPVDVAE